MGLPDEYCSAVSSLLTSARGLALSVNEVKATLQREEERLRVRAEKANAQAGPSVAALAARFGSSAGVCHYCNKPGHYERECRKRIADESAAGGAKGKYQPQRGKPKQQRQPGNGRERVTSLAVKVVEAATLPAQVDALIASSDQGFASYYRFDSGSDVHLTGFKEDFTTFDANAAPIVVKGIGPGNLVSAGKGSVQLMQVIDGVKTAVTFEDVYYVPGCDFRLLSTDSITAKGYRLLASGDVQYMQRSEQAKTLFGIKRIWRTYLIGTRLSDGRMYIKAQTAHQLERRQALTVLKESAELWHRRYGHLSYGALAELAAGDMVSGMAISAATAREAKKANSESPCAVCETTKQTRRQFPSRPKAAAAVMERVHMDVCGPMRVPASNGARYVATFLDEYSGYSLVRCVATKDDVPRVLQETLLLMENQAGAQLREVQSDRGGEYVGGAVANFLRGKGVRHNTSAPYTPEQNGRAERLNRTLLE
ncbi:hypothetical protein GPECTOR_411g256 [Gonium pectorale]|uniref:Integrase catalytic domain-containing protein n=1 Tax=Gonium pectorale TaxID=33097 RepID=A0A150FV91_GONPE|nr:hypothetical protein GPECTOR_411g256 [Gonium pectorale]|eukprot:KXZ41532.1 hypothetical protein GPECTOR_411g256 [Gonium pectorale]